jgi:hypothetical protein
VQTTDGVFMSGADDWGRDPAVRMMRRVFEGMETAQETFLKRIGVSPMDARLKRWRKKALDCFERCWSKAARTGVDMNERRAAGLYVRCLAGAMGSEGMAIPSELLSPDEETKRIFKEALS